MESIPEQQGPALAGVEDGGDASAEADVEVEEVGQVGHGTATVGLVVNP